MKILFYFKKFAHALWGSDFHKTLIRHREAADALDRAVKEMIEK
ncbi:MAG: hypothetical protein AAF871_11825 [Pseudomonadota bacterium]